jgi:hypothetical protein
MLCSLGGGEHLEQLSGYQFLNRGSALLDNIEVNVAAVTIIRTLSQFNIYLLTGIDGQRPITREEQKDKYERNTSKQK